VIGRRRSRLRAGSRSLARGYERRVRAAGGLAGSDLGMVGGFGARLEVSWSPARPAGAGQIACGAGAIGGVGGSVVALVGQLGTCHDAWDGGGDFGGEVRIRTFASEASNDASRSIVVPLPAFAA